MNTQIHSLNDQDLLAVAGGTPNPADATGMTWDEIRTNPEEFEARWAEYRKDHPPVPGLLGSGQQIPQQ